MNMPRSRPLKRYSVEMDDTQTANIRRALNKKNGRCGGLSHYCVAALKNTWWMYSPSLLGQRTSTMRA
jgi:hypothetical protein